MGRIPIMFVMQLCAAVLLRKDDPLVVEAPEQALEASVDAGIAAEAEESLKEQTESAAEGVAAEDLLGTETTSLPSTNEDNQIEEVEEGSPTHAPLAAHSSEDPVEAATEDVVEMIPSEEPNVVARDDVDACDCDCCVVIRREVPAIATNFTCTPGVLGMEGDQLACEIEHSATCAISDTEVFDYTLFCTSHCRGVASEPQTQCMAVEDDLLPSFKEGGVWVDNMMPTLQESGGEAVAVGGLDPDPVATSSPQEQADVAEQKAIVDGLYGEKGTLYEAQLSLGNAKLAAGV